MNQNLIKGFCMVTKLLSELSINISSGLTPLRSNARFWENGTISWLKTEQLGEKYIYETNEHISEAALEKTSIRLFPEDSLSIAMYGEGKTRGNLSILKQPMTTNQACCNVVLDPKKADCEYVYYFLKTQYDELRNLSSGVRKNLNSNDIKNYPIRLPETLSEQKLIAQVLKVIDDKIELNNRINAELEAMAKTLYDYWFVQFDFPDANGQPYKTAGGKMVYNPTLKREIPEGWHALQLNMVVDNISTGISASQIPSHKPYTPIDALPMKRMSFGVYEPASNAKTSLLEYQKNDILIGAMRVYFHRVCIAPFDGITRSTTMILRPKSQGTMPYLYQLCNEDRTIAVASKISTGTQQPYVNWDNNLENYYFASPRDNQLIKMYCQKTQTITEMVIKNETENQRLIELRDWLLPMLMNGQVTVNNG